jgi:small-conductance mechanosensitive channel
MSNQPNLTFIVDQITKLSIFLNRAPVQIQLGVILISILVSHSLFYGVSKKIKENFPQLAVNLAQETTLAPYWCGLILIPDLVSRGFSLIVLNLFHDLFIHQGWIAGIMAIAIHLLWVYLFYRIFVVSLCLFIPINRVKECNVYFFRPIFILYFFREVLNLFIDFDKFLQVAIINLFGSSITIGDILISTVGLYLWIVAVNILQYILGQITINSTKLNSGNAQASLILIRYFLITLGIVIVIGYLGFDSTTFAAITGGLSVGIGFGLKEVFSNFISGIFLLFEGSL